MKINPLKAEKFMEMSVFMQKLQIRQKTCYIEQNGSGGPIILWGMYPPKEEPRLSLPEKTFGFKSS